MRHLVVLALLWAGVAVVVLSCVALLVLPTVYDKLHALAPASSLGAVLVAVALSLDIGMPHSIAKYLFTAGLLAVTGPVAGIATARAMLANERRDCEQAPQ